VHDTGAVVKGNHRAQTAEPTSRDLVELPL
jgi:hypothetical protein